MNMNVCSCDCGRVFARALTCMCKLQCMSSLCRRHLGQTLPGMTLFFLSSLTEFKVELPLDNFPANLPRFTGSEFGPKG